MFLGGNLGTTLIYKKKGDGRANENPTSHHPKYHTDIESKGLLACVLDVSDSVAYGLNLLGV